MNEEIMAYVPMVHYELIRIRDLVSNQNYQRSLSEDHVEKTVKNFNLYLVNPVKVSRRDGTNYVFDGQHTIEIIAKASNSRDTPVWCMIYDDLTYEAEADIFANQQRFTKQLSPYDIFNANIEAKNDTALLIKSLVESYGIEIRPGGFSNGICAVRTLEIIYDDYGFDILDHTLRLILTTWDGESHSFSRNMLCGVSKLLYIYGDHLKDSIFIEKCGRASIKEIARSSKDRRAGSLGFAETLLFLYNKKSKNPLLLDALYMGKHSKRRKKNSLDTKHPANTNVQDSLNSTSLIIPYIQRNSAVN